MILIADSGATKASWCLLQKGNVCVEFTSPGINAAFISQRRLSERIAVEVVPSIREHIPAIRRVHFYGAGCLPATCRTVADAITEHIPEARVEVATDMLGVCRALCRSHSGVVCILGTGANSCLYDGECITDNIPPLGFILGDEGSGAYLGKMLLSDVLKRQLPLYICQEFIERYDIDAQKAVQHVYREDAPSRYLASFAPFLREKISDPHIRALVTDAFRSFFRRNVCAYKVSPSTPVHFCGSIAFYFKDVLLEAAESMGITIGNVIREPMENLKKYHGA